jgi:hypothetical protein
MLAYDVSALAHHTIPSRCHYQGAVTTHVANNKLLSHAAVARLLEHLIYSLCTTFPRHTLSRPAIHYCISNSSIDSTL